MNDPLTKKQLRELYILNHVYTFDANVQIKPSDKPDILVDDKINNYGVEITEYYQHNTGGRLANDSGYRMSLLSGGIVDKKDSKYINTGSLTIEINGAQTLIADNILFTPTISAANRFSRLASIIETKNLKYKNYSSSLDYIDLIIFDQGDLQAGSDGKQIISQLQSMQERNPVGLDTPFKNIYVFSKKLGNDVLIHLWSS